MVDQRFKNPQDQTAGGLHLWAQDIVRRLREGFGASLVSYDNTTSGLTGENVQDAIDEVADLNARIDAVYGTTRGSLLHRGAAAWALLTPGTSGHFLKSNGTGADLSWAAITPAVWEQIGSDRAVDNDEIFTGLDNYSSIWLSAIAVTQSSSGKLCFQVSSDGGSSWVSGASDYRLFSTGGVVTGLDNSRLIDTNTTAARDASAIIYGWNLAKPKWVKSNSLDVHIDASAAMNALRFFSDGAGTPNGGTVRIYGLPAT